MFRRGISVMSAVLVCVLCAAGLASADRQYGQFWVYGSIERGYLETGGPGKWGNPTSPEQNAARGGKFQTFGGSSFYWHPNVDPARGYQVGGIIGDKWGQLGWENSKLGYPTTHELGTPDGSGRFNFFEGGAIYWSPATGAHPVWGQILETWAGSGYEKSTYGYPTSDEYNIDGGKAQKFQRGTIEWKQDGYPDDWAEDPNIDPSSIDTDDAASAGVYADPQTIPMEDDFNAFRSVPGPGTDNGDTPIQSCDTAEAMEEGAVCIDRYTGNEGQEELQQAEQPSAPAGDSATATTSEPATTTGDAPPSEDASPSEASRTEAITDTAVPDEGLPDMGNETGSGDFTEPRSNYDRLFADVAPQAQNALGPTWCAREWKGGTQFACKRQSGAGQVVYVVFRIINGKKTQTGSISGNEYRELAPAWNKTQVPIVYSFDITATTGEATGANITATPYCTPEPSCPVMTPQGDKDVAEIARPGATLYGTWDARANISETKLSGFNLSMKIVVYAGKSSGHFSLAYPSFRCDALGSRRAPEGCRTNRVTPVFNEVNSGPSMHRHLQSAKDAGLPGFTRETALRRQTDQQEITYNRRFSCGTVSGPRPTGMECDEYPYASTNYARAIYGRKVATYSWCNIRDTGLILDPAPSAQPVSSVCLIPRSENRSSGGRLTWFYEKTRTLNNDFFFVAI